MPSAPRAHLELGGADFIKERRHTKVISHLQDERSLVHLVFAVLIRVREKWNKKSFSAFEQHQIRSWRERIKLDDHDVPMNDSQYERQIRRSAASAA